MKATFSINNPYLNQKQNWFTKHFGDKQFVKLLFRLFVPAVLQSLISIIVLYVDNFSLAILVQDPIQGNAAKDALGIANPIINFQIFLSIGWLGGTGIMMSQYFGNKDTVRTKQTTAFRLWTSLLIQFPLIVLTCVIPGKLINIASNTNIGLSYELSRIYLFYTSFTFIPYVIANTLSFSLQETKRPIFSFLAALMGMATNIILDPIVIILSQSVEQAVMLVALSTGMARIVQIIAVLIYIKVKKDQYINFWSSWRILKHDCKTIIKYGMATFVNEVCYAFLNTILMICLLSFNPDIHTATTNVVLVIEFTTVIWPGNGAACAILIGSELGNHNVTKAKENANKMIAWGIVFAITISTVVLILSLFINPVLSPAASPEMNQLATHLQWMFIPIVMCQGVFSVFYYSIRAGGSNIVILADSLIMFIFTIIIASVTFTHNADNWNPILFMFFVKSEEIAKTIVSGFIFKYYKWAKPLTNKQNETLVSLQYETSEI